MNKQNTILELLGNNKTQKEISKTLGVSINYIGAIISNERKKCIKNRIEIPNHLKYKNKYVNRVKVFSRIKSKQIESNMENKDNNIKLNWKQLEEKNLIPDKYKNIGFGKKAHVVRTLNKMIKGDIDKITVELLESIFNRKAVEVKQSDLTKVNWGDRKRREERRNEFQHYIENCNGNYKYNNNILTNETPFWVLANKMQGYNFFIAENNEHQYDKMIKRKPQNVKELTYRNISEYSDTPIEFRGIWLDCCGTWNGSVNDNYSGSVRDVLIKLVNKIRKCSVFGVTISARHCKHTSFKKEEYYKFIIEQITNIVGGNTTLLNYKSYSDGGNMVTFFFKVN